MSHSKVVEPLQDAFANTYALFLKTQNYHWHVSGPHFKLLHELFEEQYQELFAAVDLLAERIITLESKAPATFKDLMAHSSLQDGQSNYSASDMLHDLIKDHSKVIESLAQALEVAQDQGDEGSIALLGERIAVHEKQRWMLRASNN